MVDVFHPATLKEPPRETEAIPLLLIMFLTLNLVAAQSTNGTISGIVSDPNGKVVPAQRSRSSTMYPPCGHVLH